MSFWSSKSLVRFWHDCSTVEVKTETCIKESQVSSTRRKLESCGQCEKMWRNNVYSRDLWDDIVVETTVKFWLKYLVMGKTVRFSLSSGVVSAGPPELAK